MKKHSLLIAFAAVLILTGSALAGPSTNNSKASGLERISGTVVTSSSSELVLTSKIKGKEEQETFVVNPQTKTMGTVAKGERVMVHYKNENGQKTATMISAHKMMAAKNK